MRKKIKIIGALLLLTIGQILYPGSASAHLMGQPPFFKINGAYANLYPTPLTSLYNFDLPQDLAPQSYLVNQPIDFELDQGRLPAPPEVIAKTRFNWDFADGTHEQGLKNTHQFNKIGSYIIKIYADDGTTPTPQMLESALLNILPDNHYNLPQAKILVNGKSSADPLNDVIKTDFQNPVQLDGSLSTQAEDLVEYFWDFGDQKAATGLTQTHKYPADLSQVFVVLRVKDKNGFLADNYVEIQNVRTQQNRPASASATTPPTNVASPKKPNLLPFSLAGLGILVIIILVIRQLWVKRSRKG